MSAEGCGGVKRRPRGPHRHRYAPLLPLLQISRSPAGYVEAILESLDASHLHGVALDVTSPEPLPAGHALFAHERAIVTPHLSGDVRGEMDEVVRMCVDGVRRWRRGGGLWNVVDVERGY